MSHLNINGVDKPLDHIRLNNVRSEQLLNCTIEQGTINSIGQLANHQNRVRTSDFVQLAAGIYTISMQNADQYAGFYFIYDAATEMFVERLPSDWAHFPLTFTLQSTQKVKFVFRFTDASPITPSDISNIMLNTGSTAKPYYPYLITKEAWEARDKNDHLLWGRADTFTGTNSISARCYGLPVKSWEIDGNSQQSGVPAPDDPIMPEFVGERTENLWNEDYTGISDTITYKPVYVGDGQFTMSNSAPRTSDLAALLFLLSGNVSSGASSSANGVWDEQPRTVTSTDGYVTVAFRTVRTFTPVGTHTMLNLGSTALPYEPYGYKLPITSANQTVPVYLGQVQTVRRVKKLVLTGEEDWTMPASASNVHTYRLTINGYLRENDNIPLCTHYNGIAPIYGAAYIGDKQTAFLISTSGNNYFYIRDDNVSTVEDFKTYLAAQYAAGTPVTVWYVLATPETGIVNEPLAKIGTYADELHSADAGITIPTTDGNNTISVDTTLSPSRFEIKVHAKPIHYGFKIDKSVSDPSNAVIYTHDAVTMTPAGMDFTNGVFDYGSWENVWFIKGARPVMLNFDGTEAYDLDPNDYTKKLDGTPSDIADSTKTMNAMIAFPTVWIKRTDDGSYNYIEISDRQLDSDFHAYAHEDANGVVKPYIYLPIYKGSLVDGKLRSISGVKPQSGTTAQQEVDAASALGTGWQIWDYTSKEMLCDLLTLISKSLNTQGAFGQGHSTGGSSASDFLDCGTLNDNGKFFGYSTTTSQVKCFGMEAPWAERWERELGLILDAGIYKIKEHPAYNLTGEGYTAISTSVAQSPASNGYIKTEVSTQFGSLPTAVGGTTSTYYCDYFEQNQSGIRVARRGGYCDGGASAGLRYVILRTEASGSTWSLGASPVYK